MLKYTIINSKFKVYGFLINHTYCDIIQSNIKLLGISEIKINFLRPIHLKTQLSIS